MSSAVRLLLSALLAAPGRSGADSAPLVPHSASYRCCINRTIRMQILDQNVPMKYNIKYNPDGTHTLDGYLPRVLDLIEQETGATFETIPVSMKYIMTEGFMPSKVAEVDIILSIFEEFSYGPHYIPIVTGQGNNISNIEYTIPWHQGSLTGVVWKTPKDMGMWRLFAPFDTDLWGAIVGMIFFFALAIGLMQVLRDPKSMREQTVRERAHTMMMCVYHAWAAFLGGEDAEWVTWPHRLFRVGLLFFILISVSTYTANLAAFFTAPAFKLWGPKNLAELSDATVCGLFDNDEVALTPWIKRFIGSGVDWMVLDGSVTYDGSNIDICTAKLRSREADVIMMETVVASRFIIDNCNEYAIVPSLYIPGGWTSMFAMGNDPASVELRHHLNNAIYHVLHQPHLLPQVHTEEFAVGRTCPVIQVSDTASVTLDSQIGLFIASGAICAAAIVFEVALAIRRSTLPADSAAADAEMDSPLATDGMMLKAVLHKLAVLPAQMAEMQRVIAESSAPQRPHPPDPPPALVPGMVYNSPQAAQPRGSQSAMLEVAP